MASERTDKHKPRYKRILLKLSGEALMGDGQVRHLAQDAASPSRRT